MTSGEAERVLGVLADVPRCVHCGTTDAEQMHPHPRVYMSGTRWCVQCWDKGLSWAEQQYPHLVRLLR